MSSVSVVIGEDKAAWDTPTGYWRCPAMEEYQRKVTHFASIPTINSLVQYQLFCRWDNVVVILLLLLTSANKQAEKNNKNQTKTKHFFNHD